MIAAPYALRVLSRFAVRGPCPLGRGRALAYRSAPHHWAPLAGDAAGQRLARNPLPRATRWPHTNHTPLLSFEFLGVAHMWPDSFLPDLEELACVIPVVRDPLVEQIANGELPRHRMRNALPKIGWQD